MNRHGFVGTCTCGLGAGALLAHHVGGFCGCGMALPLTKATCLLFLGRVGSQQQRERRIPAGLRLQTWVWIQVRQPREKQPVQAIDQGISGSDVLKSCPLLAVYRRRPPNNVFSVCVNT